MDNATLRYYEERAQEYREKNLDRAWVKPFMEDFLRLVPSSDHQLLDVGCGPGLDTADFLSRGFSVMALDSSFAMLSLTSQLAMAKGLSDRLRLVSAIIPDDEDREVPPRGRHWIDEIGCGDNDYRFKGIWACCSLVHLRPKALGKAMLRLSGKLLEYCPFWLCVKSSLNDVSQGLPEGHLDPSGRTFFFHDPRSLAMTFSKCGLMVIDWKYRREDGYGWEYVLCQKEPDQDS